MMRCNINWHDYCILVGKHYIDWHALCYSWGYCNATDRQQLLDGSQNNQPKRLQRAVTPDPVGMPRSTPESLPEALRMRYMQGSRHGLVVHAPARRAMRMNSGNYAMIGLCNSHAIRHDTILMPTDVVHCIKYRGMQKVCQTAQTG